jgi:ABC-type dipeptide/oligopeptide/nickel transport system permease subunit
MLAAIRALAFRHRFAVARDRPVPVGIGNMVLIDPEDARPLFRSPRCGRHQWDYPFGTDRQGRDLLAAMVVGTPLTLRIGFIAGILGVGIGTRSWRFTAGVLSRHDRHDHPRHRRYRPDRAGPAGADHHRRLGPTAA